jgi:hypothetical protein
MLENLAKPVVLTGSQIPFGEVYNDARRNLIISMIFASRCWLSTRQSVGGEGTDTNGRSHNREAEIES